jgi:hypothetical protein
MMLLSLLLACADAETCESDQGDARVCVFMDTDSVTGVAGAYVGFRVAGDEEWIDTIADADSDTEPHADAEKYRRLHVIVGDSNMSETSTLL